MVAVVEVSVDGGVTWYASGRDERVELHVPAQGRSARSRSRSRAVDDSVNIEPPGPGVTLTGVPRGVPGLDLARLDRPAPRRRSTTPTPSRSGSSSAPSRTASSPASASTRGRATPGRTSVTCGAPRARSWPRSRSRPRRPAGGSRRCSRRRSPWRPARPTSCRTSPRWATTRPTSADCRRRTSLAAAGARRRRGRAQRRFRYGSSGFPDTSYAATNYWVDVVFDIDDHGGPRPSSTAPGARPRRRGARRRRPARRSARR